MRKNRNKLAITARCLIVCGCFLATSAQASLVNLTWSEDSSSFTSTWRIEDNGGGDFSGTDSISGTYWNVGMTSDASAVLQDTVAHILGPHGESFISSPFDYGALPTSYYEVSSFVVHPNSHRDDYTMVSDYADGGYNISLIGVHSIPIPAAVWLFGSGLGLLGWFRRKV
jgi:hypothetical protein